MRITIILSAVLGQWTCQPPDPLLTSQASASYDVGTRPQSVAAADLNRDGALDVAVANSADGTVTILLGGGRLRPAVGSPFPAGREPSDVDAADLDRDGDVDLAFANHETSRVTVLLNDGHARFTAAPGSPFETGARPHVHGLATADFDGDGWLDVAVESADTKEVRVLRGGRRGFGEIVAVSVGTMPYSRLGAADVAGDEHPDVLVPGHGDSTVRVVHRAGRSLALAAWNIRLPSQPWMVVGEDVNGDRRADLIVVHSDAVGVWLAGRDGFSPAPGSPFPVRGATEVATGDLDGDGVADVAVGPWDGDEVTVLTGRSLTARKIRTCERPVGLAIADLNGDRRGELLAACANRNRLVVVTVPVGR
ncbi:MAG: VCBS repeat-containing protein [Acidobacteriota bacterium]|nr:VCBS repeat-containing protein [Acidobacteriota bacterium]